MSEGTIVLTDAQGVEKGANDPLIATPETDDELPEEYARQMPQPTGYQILITIPEIDERTDSGALIKSVETLDMERISAVVGFVLEMGPDCYADPERFPSGPYCKRGDFILFHAYSGTKVNVYGKELRFINDDTVKAVVDDPRGIRRA